jgi:uncharacterized surface protein with fasciclin (FAS1) repeats
MSNRILAATLLATSIAVSAVPAFAGDMMMENSGDMNSTDSRYEYQMQGQQMDENEQQYRTDYQPMMKSGDNSFQRVAQENVDTTVLAALLDKADLEEVLGQGEYTVFAPSNRAFGKLPEGTITKLMLPENKETLRQLLMYHVVRGDIKAGDIQMSPATVATLAGETISAQKDMNGIVTINGQADVNSADIMTSNGTIHVIDEVLMPSQMMNTNTTSVDSTSEYYSEEDGNTNVQVLETSSYYYAN